VKAKTIGESERDPYEKSGIVYGEVASTNPMAIPVTIPERKGMMVPKKLFRLI